MMTSRTSVMYGRKRALVLGANGMAGHMVARYLHEKGHHVVRATRDGGGEGFVRFDATDAKSVARVLASGDFDCVVNCVGALVAQSSSSPLEAVLLNAALPRLLERETAGTGCRVIHLSTDCVFSGSTGSYVESAFKDGDSIYDRAKALGEIQNEKDLTLRMSIIGPEIRTGGTGLLHWFLGSTGSVRGFTNAMWNGITTLELAKAIDAVLEGELTGLYHLVPPYSISKHDLLIQIAKSFHRDLIVLPDESVVVDKTLIDTRACFPIPVGGGGYAAMLDDLRVWITQHPDLYGSDRRYEVGRPV